MLGTCSALSGRTLDASLPILERPLILLLIGPPGAGKGTHAGPLSQEFGLPHIATGDLFRDNIRNETPLGKKAKEFIDIGKLVPDELVFDMVFARISQADCCRGSILDGFPRTLPQAKVFDAKLSPDIQLLALNFEVPDSAIVDRISGRLMCRGCGKPYHKTFDPPPRSYTCQVCGGSLYQRDDDQKDVILKRLQVYHEQTKPILTYLAAKEGVLHSIDGLQSKEEVYKAILESLQSWTASILSR